MTQLGANTITAYSQDAECPKVGIYLEGGGHRFHDHQLHDWRCLSTPDGLLWYCTRCKKISTRQPRRPRKKVAQ